MPSYVDPHESHSSRGRPYRVRGFTRYGPEHSPKWERLVAELAANEDVTNPYAVATAALGPSSYAGRGRNRRSRKSRR